jgi:hypothetical protein
MSKPVIWLVVLVAAAGMAVGAYYIFDAAPLPAPTTSTPIPEPATPTPMVTPKPKPDHGNFEKRFQPSIPANK